MIRFENATPQAIWYNQHASGQAFTYNATEKQGRRPLGYSGNGTHATYSTPGLVPSVLKISTSADGVFSTATTTTQSPALTSPPAS